MASSSSSATHISERTIDFSSQTAPEMESARIRHWSILDYSRTSSEWSAVTNFEDFDMLKEHPVWGRFFRDFHTLELGEKISEGAQADIFEARMRSDGPFNLVAKVMKGDAPLKAFQAQWPIGMLSACSSESFVFDLPVMTMVGGTVLTERRLWGRFAFVMYRRWGDLRLLIDRRMKHKRTSLGPFSLNQVIQLMLRIAKDMEGLHDKYNIIHRDLKTSNVLVWGEFGDNVNVVAPSQGETIESVVADFECSLGVLGTGWWRAPEILQQLSERIPSSQVQFTRKSDIYSYGMTCYEIVSGCLPFEGRSASKASCKIVCDRTLCEDQSVSEGSYMGVCEDQSVSEGSYMSVLSCLPSSVSSASEESGASYEIVSIDEVLNGRRPYLPVELPPYLKTIIVSCWQSDPEERPSFSNICKMLEKPSYRADVVIHNTRYIRANVIIDNTSNGTATIIKVKSGENLPLLEALERLLQMQLSVSKAVYIAPVRDGRRKRFEQYFEVKDGEGRKVCDENCIVKVLSVPSKEEWYYNEESNSIGSPTSLIHVMVAIGGPSLLRSISTILVELGIQLHSLKSWSDDTHVNCDMFVEGTNVDSLLPQILARVAGSKVLEKDLVGKSW